MKIFILFLFLSFHPVASGQDTTEYLPVEYPTNYDADINVIYSNIDGWEGKLDVYFPKNSNMPVPVVINIHGGGWRKGVKESQRGFKMFFERGWAVANISYRLSGTAKAPAAIVDCRNAMIFLVNNCEKYNIDPLQIVTVGGSAGGHLALMIGLLRDQNNWESMFFADKDYKVKLIINKYGVTDIQEILSEQNKLEFAIEWVKGYESDNDFLKSISPLYYIDENSPPVISIHGDEDPTVPYQQAVVLHQALNEKGVENLLLTIPGGKHGKFSSEENSRIKSVVTDFLDRIWDQ